MAAQYREDFGFGDDEEFQGYISEHDDDLKEHFNSDTFGNVYVDNSASDYTGRIMIIRPEYFSSRNFTPEEQLFLAQSGPGCDPKEYGGAVNGVFLYDREEASVTSDCFLGASVRNTFRCGQEKPAMIFPRNMTNSRRCDIFCRNT